MNINTSMNLNFIIPEAYLKPSQTPTKTDCLHSWLPMWRRLNDCHTGTQKYLPVNHSLLT